MIDIVILALPADRAKADLIADGLIRSNVAGPNRSRLIVSHPSDADWPEAISVARTTPCVLFCWSQATGHPDALPMAELAERICSAGKAISIEFDIGTRPAQLSNCTTYPFYGRRCSGHGFWRFVHGNGYSMQIANAAQQKVLGLDPPAAASLPRMVRKQAWIMLVGLAAPIGLAGLVLAFYRDPAVAKWLDPEAARAFETAKTSDTPCGDLRTFGEKHNGSAWSEQANELLETCSIQDVTIVRPMEQRLEVFGKTKEDAETDGQRKCEGLARVSGATLVASRIEDFVAGERATAICGLQQPVLEQVETIGNRRASVD